MVPRTEAEMMGLLEDLNNGIQVPVQYDLTNKGRFDNDNQEQDWYTLNVTTSNGTNHFATYPQSIMEQVLVALFYNNMILNSWT